MLCVLIIGAIVLIRRYGGTQPAMNAIVSKAPMMQQNPSENDVIQQNETPLDSVTKRYAKGEMSREEFEEMKKNLDN